ncbi:MAG: MerR family DNA-binding transcriptional regulator [Alphaproteobacteria bacterium]|nr:MerR family DNA-binding transcriptional regulator [Alphaproteobacteria bacterium]
MEPRSLRQDRRNSMSEPMKSEQPQRYTITQLCREFDVTPRTLRFYEQKDLLHPAREGMNRIFSHRDRARLSLILRGKKVGFSLDDIKEMLDLYNLKDGQITQLQVAHSKGLSQLDHLKEQKVALDDAIGDLQRAIEIIEGMLTERGVRPQLEYRQAESA